MDDKQYGFDDLQAIMDRLRDPQSGCPWDLEQTLKTLRTYLLEEVYEALEAIDSNDPQALCEELGDSLFEIVFLAKVSEQEGHFDIHQVIDKISRKMIRRHPHIFTNDVQAQSAAEVEGIWARAKVEEKNDMASILQGVPRQLPALLRAYRLSERVSKVGFDWEKARDVLDKLQEETAELVQAAELGDREQLEAEFGDLLFTVVNLGRHLEISAEDALRRTCDKFVDRFSRVELLLKQQGLDLQSASLDQMEQAWSAVKN
ncbi:MAG: nucleoside triphosphate pyrophosphohydrolase [Candidatus Alcyoniella australis]|nr:nucleoside triphosphate pyrophosphohydrolase [Candidatus Alcyoniella australis]